MYTTDSPYIIVANEGTERLSVHNMICGLTTNWLTEDTLQIWGCIFLPYYDEYIYLCSLSVIKRISG